MLLTIEQQNIKQIELEELIDKLSYQISDKEINDIINKLSNVYTDNFRHRYSNFYPKIKDIDSEATNKDDGKSLETLQENLDQLLVVINNKFSTNEQIPDEKKHFIKCINKLIDHLNLEITRYTNVNSLINENIKINEAILASKTEFQKTKDELCEAQNELSIANQKIDNSKIDVITALSIFSAIILSFTGGFSFLTNSFAQIQATSFYKLTFFILLVGVILFNALYLMFHLIGKIIDRKIDISCISTFNISLIIAMIINFVALFLTNNLE